MTERIESARKVIEIVGVSSKGFDDAVAGAVAKAAESISGISSVEVVRQSATVRDGKVATYEATVKLTFVVH